jgi:GNAT superfamily N-acetyltransferase
MRRATLPPAAPVVPAAWIDPLAERLARAPAFAGLSLRAAVPDDEPFLFELHRAAMRAYVEATWSWDDQWQRNHFARNFEPWHHAIIVRRGPPSLDVGRLSLTYHWRRIYLRDIELTADERNHGVGTAILDGVLELGRASGRHVELMVLRCNPAQRLYARMGFRVVTDDGARLMMRTD